MSPRKLTEDDKQEILQLYRNSEATTSTLATRYEVSSSTISRFLKNKLTPLEYEDLIQKKRLARTHKGEKSSEDGEQTSKNKKTQKKSQSKVQPIKIETVIASDDGESTEQVIDNIPNLAIAETETESQTFPVRRRRRRSSVTSEPTKSETVATESQDPEESIKEQKNPKRISKKNLNDIPEVAAKDDETAWTPKRDQLILKTNRGDLEEEEDDDEVDMITLKEMLGEDLEDINDDEDEDDEEDDDDEYNEESMTYSGRSSSLSNVQILPLSQASLLRTCYLVIDRSAELIVKPLEDFADLGAIPQEEFKQTTLPVFDNHRIAKRFSHRRERVIKVPDGRMLQKTSHHLQNKGITRLLIDGQIYSLPS